MPSPQPTPQILIVEDEFAIADDLMRALREDGFSALRPVADPASAIAALDASRVDFAVVDINLEGAISFEVAAELRRRAVPFLFLTGYEKSVLPPEFGEVTVLQKPHDGGRIVAEIKAQAGARVVS